MNDVQQTSISAYNEDVRSGKIPSQRRRIEKIIQAYGPITRRDIRKIVKWLCEIDNAWGANIPDIPMSSVCGRVRALIDSNLIHVSDHKTDPTTGKRVQLLKWGPQPKLNGNQYELDI